jgi:hypothetical protein
VLCSDADGFVALWSLQTFRPYAFIKAHEQSVLHAEIWDEHLITYVRVSGRVA